MPSDASSASSAVRAKVLSLAELLARRDDARRRGKRLVQCHGCFDIVHPGHIRHLRQARAQGDILLVTITSDVAFTKRSSGPLIPAELRAENLAELDCVDWVCIDDHPTALELLQKVRPDIYVKGKEYESNNDPRFAAERAAVEAAGGRVVFSSGDVVFSSSALIAALERSADPYHARLSQLLARPELDGVRLNSTLNAFRNRRVLVVGETIIDRYHLCDAPEVASESPVLTLRPIEQRTYDGGAAIIARHLAAMGASPVLLTALPHGGDPHLVARLSAEGVEVLSIAVDQPLPHKDRYLVGAQKVMKVNNLTPFIVDAANAQRLVELAAAHARNFDAAIVADYGNGLLSAPVIHRLGDALRPLVSILVGDVSGTKSPLASFRNFDLLSPSESEARGAMRAFEDSLPALAWRTLEAANAKRLFITLGGDGLIAFEPLPDAHDASDTNPNRSRVRGEHVPALCRYPLDPLGCGDSLLAAATLALATGASTLTAAFLGSLAAASQAQRLGNIPISAADIRVTLARVASARLAFAPGDTSPATRVELLAS